jgi:hypothetical protein
MRWPRRLALEPDPRAAVFLRCGREGAPGEQAHQRAAIVRAVVAVVLAVQDEPERRRRIAVADLSDLPVGTGRTGESC